MVNKGRESRVILVFLGEGQNTSIINNNQDRIIIIESINATINILNLSLIQLTSTSFRLLIIVIASC